MLYLYIDRYRIKLLYLKRSILGQYEATYFEKKYELELLENGKVKNIDVLASSLKEALGNIPEGYDKHVFLIIPQTSVSFIKAEIPKDIAPSAINSFILDKARSTLLSDFDNSYYDYFINEVDNQKQINFFSIGADALEGYVETLNLLGLKLVSILPETLAVFKLFEKTLRKEKKENILYVSYDGDFAYGFLFDTGGLKSDKKWTTKVEDDNELESLLKEKKEEYEKEGIVLNRIILSGKGSENIRQDTFTKNVGVWTNPLKRIIPNFYSDYIKMIILQSGKTFPILSFDMCFGAFIFAQENKDFQILKKPIKKTKGMSNFKMPNIKKEILIFLAAAILSFGIFFAISRSNIDWASLNFFAKTQPTPTVEEKAPTPTPTPEVVKEEIRIKILNGSGTAGKAGEVEDILNELGYTETVTDNAESFDYTTTEIQVKTSFAHVIETLTEDLSEYVSSTEITTLDEDDTSDVIIIVATDFK
ncbi:MAG: LytR C-terminal domain-containing protein [Patescibacteria group bacterium]